MSREGLSPEEEEAGNSRGKRKGQCQLPSTEDHDKAGELGGAGISSLMVNVRILDLLEVLWGVKCLKSSDYVLKISKTSWPVGHTG